MKGAVTDVASPGNGSEGRIRRHPRLRIYQVHESRGQNVGSLISEITGGSHYIQRQLSLNRRGPGSNVVVFAIAIQIARRNHTQAAVFGELQERRQGIGKRREGGIAE